MRILLYAVDFPPSIGGIQTISEILASGLAAAKTGANGNLRAIDVTVVTRTPAGACDDSKFPFRVVRQPGFAALVKLVRETDIVHVVGPAIVPMAVGLLFGKAVAVQHGGYMAVCPIGNYLHLPDESVCPGHFQKGNYLECYRCQCVEMSRGKSVRNLLLMMPRRWLLERVAVNIGASDHTGRRVGLPRTVTIYHGIEDPLALTRGAEPRAVGPQDRLPIQFGFIGRLVSEKGVDLLLEAAAKVRSAGADFRLKIIGDGPDRRRLESLAAELGLGGEVSFLGYRNGEELAALLSEISVSVIPSRCEEAFGLTAVEQMMRGKLVVAADIGGLGEVVSETALKFAPGDAEELAACMRRIIEHPELIDALGEAARPRALELFSKEAMVREHLALYGRLMSGRAAARD